MPAAVAALASVAGAAVAQELMLRVEPAVPPAFVVDERQFDSIIFNNAGTAASAREELEAQVEARIGDVERYCDLSDEQEDRIRLAARGDMERFFARVDQKRDEMQGRSFEPDKINEAFQELRPLQQEYTAGLLGEGSLLSKATARILDPEQAARYGEVVRERRAFQYQVNIDMFVARMGTLLGLTAAQRDRFAEAIREGTPVPRLLPENNPYISFLIASRVAELSEDAIRPIFDDAQWDVLRPFLDQAAQMMPALRAQGLIEEEAPE